MNKSRSAFAAGTAALMLLLQAAALADAASDEREIAAIRAASNAAIARHDVAAIVAAFDTPYQLNTGAGLLFHDDPAAQAENWAGHFAELPDVVYVRTPERIDISSYLPRAAESGTWIGTWTTPAGPVRVGGSYAASWRKTGGAWKIQSELFVTLYCEGAGCAD